MSLREDKQLAWDMELVNQTCIFKPSNFTLKTPSVFFLIYRISCLPAHHHFIYKDGQDKKRPMQDRQRVREGSKDKDDLEPKLDKLAFVWKRGTERAFQAGDHQ